MPLHQWMHRVWHRMSFAIMRLHIAHQQRFCPCSLSEYTAYLLRAPGDSPEFFAEHCYEADVLCANQVGTGPTNLSQTDYVPSHQSLGRKDGLLVSLVALALANSPT